MLARNETGRSGARNCEMAWRWPLATRKADWALLLGAGLVTLAGATVKGFTFSAGYLSPLVLSLCLITCAGLLTGHERAPRTAAALSTFAWILAMGVVGSHISYFAATANRPLIDETLLTIDAAMGWDAIAVVRNTGADTLLSSLSYAVYMGFMWQVMLAYVILIATRKLERLADTLSLMTICMIGTVVLSSMMPAIGAIVHLQVPDAVLGHLAGSNAGAWHVPHFMALREGSMLSFPEPGGWQGIITFPSFHVIHALVAGYALSCFRWLALPSAIVSGFIIFTAVSVGGHYVIDLVAGHAVFAASLWYVSRRTSPRFGRKAQPACLPVPA
jgi:hypothetical protein